MLKTRKGLLLLIILFFVFGGSEKLGLFKDIFSKINSKETSQSVQSINLTQNRVTHILYGDTRGGGHLYGVGKPCKTEFPRDWDENKIIKTIQDVAANDNLSWEQQKNGYYVAQEMVDGVRVRVVLDRERDDIVTAYPLNQPKNSCNVKQQQPANDNLNLNE